VKGLAAVARDPPDGRLIWPMKCTRSLCIAALALLGVRTAGAEGSAPGTSRADAASPFTAGLEALERSDYAPAEKALQSVGGPQRMAARLALARAAFEQGRYSEAEQQLSDVLREPVLRLPAIALEARVWAAQGKIDAAIKALDTFKDASGAAGRRIRLELGELLVRAGRRADAEPVLLQFMDDYNNDAIAATDAEGLAMVGRAMHLLRHPKDANRAYNESERAQAGRVETLEWRAELFLDHDDPGHAEAVLNEGLKSAPNRADLLVLLARANMQEALDFDAAEKLVERALAIDPKLAEAYAVRAGMELRDARLDKADASIAAGLAIDPNELELLSLRAASRFLTDDASGFSAAMKDVFARNPEYSEAYTVVGDYGEWEHRYDDVIAMMKKAVALDPHDGKAWAELGLLQARNADEVAGQASLENAWREDHFNVRVYNTLELLYGRWIPDRYESVRDGVFTLRYPKSEKAVLERYVPRMLREAWASMKTRYLFTPSTPVAIEMYESRQHFSVRTSGLPNIGIQGACFGHVVAAMSPASEPFNWGNVLWHELGHVFAIQLSDSHVPRWFTEGLSEYETSLRRPEWRRELDRELYLALKRNEVPGAAEMDTAFTHAQGDVDVTVAYYAASKMLQFTAERFGFQAIRRALALWGRHDKTPDVIREAFGVDVPHYDEAFRQWARAGLTRYDAQYIFDPGGASVDEARAAIGSKPLDPRAHVQYAAALLHSHQPDAAGREVQAALHIDPADKDALFIAAEVAGATEDLQAQKAGLIALSQHGGDGYSVEAALATNARALHDAASERRALELAHHFDPTQAEPLRHLYELAHDEHRDGDALAVLGELTGLDQHDRQAWRWLLSGLVSTGRWKEARQVGEAALFVDVENPSVHLDYARALSATGEHEQAVFELESALLCDISPEDAVQAKALLRQEKIVVAKLQAKR
jgi:tetratricopeptide (TPR) repeat protein